MGLSHDVEKWKGSALSYHTVFLPKKPRRAPPNVKDGHTNQRIGSDVSVANTTGGKCETWEVHTVPGIGGAGPSMVRSGFNKSGRRNSRLGKAEM